MVITQALVRGDLAPKVYPVLSSLERFFEVLPVFGPPRSGTFGVGGSGRGSCR